MKIRIYNILTATETPQASLINFSFIVPDKAKKITLLSRVNQNDDTNRKLLHATENNRSESLIFSLPIPSRIKKFNKRFRGTSKIFLEFLIFSTRITKIEIFPKAGQMLKGAIQQDATINDRQVQLIALIEFED